MKTEDFDLTIDRLLLGYTVISAADKTIIYKNCPANTQYKIDLLLKKFKNEIRFDFWPHDQLEFIFIGRRLLDNNYKERLQNMYTGIDDLKLELFRSGPRVEQAKRIKTRLQATRQELNKYSLAVNNLFYYSIEQACDRLEIVYSILLNCFYEDGGQVFDLDNIDYPLFREVSRKLQEETLSLTEIRKIARSDKWRSFWARGKESCFMNPISSFNDEQKLLCSYSSMYDNAFSRVDISSITINDDDRFDGWLIHQRKEAEDALKEQNAGGKQRKHFDQIFKAAETQEEANNIYQENSSSARTILQQRAKELNSGNVKVFKDMLGKNNG